MPDDRLNVNPDAVRWFAQRLAARQQEIYESALTLNGELQRLFDYGWSDPNSEKFGIRMQEFIQGYVSYFLDATKDYPAYLEQFANNLDEYNNVSQR